MLGVTQPRIATPPLVEGPIGPCPCGGCALTPDTSYGFDVIDFARNKLHVPLDLWEELAVIHGGELEEDGLTPRGLRVLIIVARQNGKTVLVRVLTVYWMLVEVWPVIFGMSNLTKNAKKSWQAVIDMIEESPLFAHTIDKILRTPGSEFLRIRVGNDYSEYTIGAANDDAARSESVDRLIVDELRQHKSWNILGAAEGAQSARPYCQTICITNQGDESSVPLVDMRNAALDYINKGEGDAGLILLEWSSPDGSDPLDLNALAQANPNLNRIGENGELRVPQRNILSKARQALKAGGEQEYEFRTNYMCQFIKAFDGAINPTAWEAGGIGQTLQWAKGRIVMFLDMSPDRRHVALVGACVSKDGRVHAERIKRWLGTDATTDMQRDLPDVLRRFGARRLLWFSGGQMKAVAPWLRKLRVAGVAIDELKSEWNEVCMHLAQQVEAGQVVYKPDDEMTDHVTGAFKKYSGKSWCFDRQAPGYCDFAYALAGAVWGARSKTAAPSPTRGFVVVGKM